MSPCRFCLAQDLLACCHHKERKIGQTGGETRAQTSGFLLTSMPGGRPGPGCSCLPRGHPASLIGKSLLSSPSRGHCRDRSPHHGVPGPQVTSPQLPRKQETNTRVWALDIVSKGLSGWQLPPLAASPGDQSQGPERVIVGPGGARGPRGHRLVSPTPQTEDRRPGRETAGGTAWPLVNAGACSNFRRGPEVSDDCVGVSCSAAAGRAWGNGSRGRLTSPPWIPSPGKISQWRNAGGGGGEQTVVTTVPRADRGRGAGTVSGQRKPRTWRGEGSGGKRFF